MKYAMLLSTSLSKKGHQFVSRQVRAPANQTKCYTEKEKKCKAF